MHSRVKSISSLLNLLYHYYNFHNLKTPLKSYIKCYRYKIFRIYPGLTCSYDSRQMFLLVLLYINILIVNLWFTQQNPPRGVKNGNTYTKTMKQLEIYNINLSNQWNLYSDCCSKNIYINNLRKCIIQWIT